MTPLADWDKAALHGDLSVFAAAFCKAVAIAATGKVDALILHRFATERDAMNALGADQIALAAGVTSDIDDVASGKAGFSLSGGFASNGYAEFSPGGYSLLACAVTEVVLTFFFLVIIIGSTSPRAPAGFAPIPIGLGLTLIHLISIPVTNTSVNPARSTGPALFAGGAHLSQLWLFWVAPIVGALIAGFVSRALQSED